MSRGSLSRATQTVAVVYLLSGCGFAAAGSWTGRCDIEDAASEEFYEIASFAVGRAEAQLGGQATVIANWQLEPFEGVVSGSQEGAEVEFEILLVDETQELRLGLTGRQSGDTMSGDCTARVNRVVNGTFTLDRAPRE